MDKLSYELTDIPTENYLKRNSQRSTRDSHLFKYTAPQTNKNVFKFSFFPKTIRELKSLPEEIVTATSIGHFKFKLADLFKSILNSWFLICTIFFVLIVGLISYH